MNPELQAQTDLIIKAISHLEHTLNLDAYIALFFLGLLVGVTLAKRNPK